MVDGAAERLPAEGGIGGIEVGEKVFGIKRCSDSSGVVAAGVGTAEINIGRFAEVTVEAKMADNTEILAVVGGENVTGVAAVNLGRSLEEPVFRSGQEPRKGDAGIVNAVLTADQIVGHQRPVNERQRVIVDRVDLAKFCAHLADFQKEPRRKRSKGDVTFLHIYPRFAEGDESVGARIGID